MSDSDSAPEITPSDVVFSRGAFAGATGMFIVFGSVASLYGPLLVTLSHQFHVSLATAGVIVSVHFAGALCGVPLGWAAIRRRPGNQVLATALAVLAVGALGVSFSSNFTELSLAIFVIGVSFGALDFLLNSLLVRTSIIGRARRLSVANAGYGIGSVLGPVLVIIARPANFPLLFAAVAAGALSLIAATKGVSAPPTPAPPRHRYGRRRVTVLAIFIPAYVLYVAAEASLSGWIAPTLHHSGHSLSFGAAATAGFWLGLALGRFLAGPAHRAASAQVLVLGGLAITTGLCLLATSTSLAPLAYPLTGLSMALVYPMGLIWFTALAPDDANALALIILVMMSGGVIGPALVSLAVSVVGIHAVPYCVAAFTAADFAVFFLARRVVAPRASG